MPSLRLFATPHVTSTPPASSLPVMRHWMILLQAVLILTLSVVSAPRAHAAATPCSNDEVTVLVEGYPPSCAAAGGNGYDTLIRAGFSVEVTQKFPDFICRINGFPDASVDACLTASPASAYWSYWHAPLGGNSWEYSDLGAFSYYPKAGTVEAWAWGDTDRPGEIPSRRPDTHTNEEHTDSSEDTTDNTPNISSGEEHATAGPRRRQADSSSRRRVAEGSSREAEDTLYYDSDGHIISREQYERLLAQADEAPPDQLGETPSGRRRHGEETHAQENQLDSSSARASFSATAQPPRTPNSAASTPAPPLASSAEQAPDQSRAWLIGITIALTIVFIAAAIAQWVIRREEV